MKTLSNQANIVNQLITEHPDVVMANKPGWNDNTTSINYKENYQLSTINKQVLTGKEKRRKKTKRRKKI